MAPQLISHILNTFPLNRTLTQNKPGVEGEKNVRAKIKSNPVTRSNVVCLRTHLSSAEPWLWLLVRREKTLRSLRVRRGGDEGGV